MKLTSRSSAAVIAGFSVIYLALCYAITVSWYRSGFYGVYNIFFDADPGANLDSFAHGWGRHAVIHAFLEAFALPIRVFEAVCFRLGLSSNRIEFRELTALAISPAFAAATNIVFYRTLRLLKIRDFDAAVVTLIFAFSFSNLLFAVIPESFAISCFLISLLFYYYFRCRALSNRGRSVVWLAIAVAMTGFTLTNLGIFAAVYAVHLRVRENRRISSAVVRSLIYSAASINIVVIYYHAVHKLMDIPKGWEGSSAWIAKYLATSPSRIALNLANFISASLNSFVASKVSVAGIEIHNGMEYNLLSFTHRLKDAVWMLPVVLFLLIVAYNTRRHIRSERWRELYLLSMLAIAYNFFLHGIFGREIFIYTQHWMVPLMLLLVPALSGRRVLSVVLLILLMLINLDFIFHIDQLIM